VLRRLEFHFVPKHASWLNMVEIEMRRKKKRPCGQVVPVSWDGEIIASGARDAGTRITSTLS
jgi:hypothetical protein